MEAIDQYSYQCGVIDCFNEVIRAGIKRIALSHPADTRAERDRYLAFSEAICARYGTRLYPEDSLLITDLFPASLNAGKFLILFYLREEDFQSYLQLKEDKARLVAQGRYRGEERRRIARAFGRLLSYTEEAVERLMASNTEKEPDAGPL